MIMKLNHNKFIDFESNTNKPFTQGTCHYNLFLHKTKIKRKLSKDKIERRLLFQSPFYF